MVSLVMSTIDRFFLLIFKNFDSVGSYSATYDFTSRSLLFLIMIVNLAAFPLAVQALEKEGVEAARKQLNNGAVLLFMTSLPLTMMIIYFTPEISNFVFGSAFRDAAAVLMPILAIAVLLSGIKSYYLDQAFQLGSKTINILWPSLIAVVLNCVFNYLWIPIWGIQGAAYASAISYTLALLISWYIGRHTFRMPIPIFHIMKILAATGFVIITLHYAKIGSVIIEFVVGISVYAVLIVLINFSKIKKYLARYNVKIYTKSLLKSENYQIISLSKNREKI